MITHFGVRLEVLSSKCVGRSFWVGYYARYIPLEDLCFPLMEAKYFFLQIQACNILNEASQNGEFRSKLKKIIF